MHVFVFTFLDEIDWVFFGGELIVDSSFFLDLGLISDLCAGVIPVRQAGIHQGVFVLFVLVWIWMIHAGWHQRREMHDLLIAA
jgi:hypothetical protein